MSNITFKNEPITLLGTEVQIGNTAPNFTVLSNSLEEKTLEDYSGKVKLISVVPSLDTGVCQEQTRRFNEEVAGLENVQVLTISVDLPFAQKRWCGAEGIDNVVTLSDHRDVDFGKKYGLLIKELRLLARAVIVIDVNDKVTYAEYVSEVTDHPNYEKAIEAAKKA